ncbi:MAG: ATP-binding cassette domain-containing protein [Balneolaceae bacterium]|nr:MAG: ATP-binding cassette domain-containing protein [Balneolaceae bacterium]
MIELRVHSLSKQYGSNRVLSGISFSSNKKTIGIAGSNGAGKSTLLLCLAGLLKPSSGSYEWFIDSENVSNYNLNHKLGFLAPYIELYEELTGMENLQFLADARHLPEGAVADAVELAEATLFIHQSYGSLSTGQRQRVKMAATLLHEPVVLMLDEPGSNLDQKGTDTLGRVIHQHTEKGGLVILASNQAMELSLCEQIIDLNSYRRV